MQQYWSRLCWKCDLQTQSNPRKERYHNRIWYTKETCWTSLGIILNCFLFFLVLNLFWYSVTCKTFLEVIQPTVSAVLLGLRLKLVFEILMPTINKTFTSLDLCNARYFLKTKNQLIKRLLSIAYVIANPEAITALKGGCPMQVSFSYWRFFILFYYLLLLDSTKHHRARHW